MVVRKAEKSFKRQLQRALGSRSVGASFWLKWILEPLEMNIRDRILSELWGRLP